MMTEEVGVSKLYQECLTRFRITISGSGISNAQMSNEWKETEFYDSKKEEEVKNIGKGRGRKEYEMTFDFRGREFDYESSLHRKASRLRNDLERKHL